ncbi:MAG TPA: N-acetylmuramoyl-L-alanine amidase, partial [Blastocatellia bacterium]
MSRTRRNKLVVELIMLALFSCVAPRPTANAPGPKGDLALIAMREVSGGTADDHVASGSPLARSLFASAVEYDQTLHARSMEDRTKGDYLRVIDSYEMVNRVGADEALAAESLYRAANTMREIADTMGDYSLYQKAITTFRRIIDEHPLSNYVGQALLAIAQIYEENVQDLEGAAESYRAIIGYFPNSVLARESRAVLTRFEDELQQRNGAPDVIIPQSDRAVISGSDSNITLENVRNYTGPDYSRVVLDLSEDTGFDREPAQNNRVTINLRGAHVSPSLYGRRFIIRDSRLLSQIVVRPGDQPPPSGRTAQSSAGQGIKVDLLATAAVEFSAFQLYNPARIVIDLRKAGGSGSRIGEPETPKAAAREASSAADRVQTGAAAGRTPAIAGDARLQERSLGIAAATLPDVDVSNLSSLQESLKAQLATGEKRQSSAGAISSEVPKITGAPATQVKCIVIDPGHGGHDTGTIGAGGLKEKDLVLAVGLRLREYIKRNYPDIEVVMTRDSDRFIALEERTAIANSRHADLFISIHANA